MTAADLLARLATAEARVRELEDRLRFLIENVQESLAIPDPACSCHVAPPCGDCVEWAGMRTALDDARKTLGATASAGAVQERSTKETHDET